MRRIISKYLNDILIEQYPALGVKSNKSYRKLLLNLIFNKTEDNYTVINRSILAICEDSYSDLLGHRYIGSKFIQKFQEEVGLSLYIKDYNRIEGKARYAKPKFLFTIEKAISEEIDNLFDERVLDKIDFVTQKKYTKNTLTQIKKELDEEVKLFYNNASEEALPLLEYLNGLPSNLFTSKVIENKNAIFKAFKDLESNETNPKLKPKKDATLKEIEKKILVSIFENAKPYYKPSSAGRTVRIFPHNVSILLLHKKLRKAVCKGWHEYDLVSSQLAIVAKLWNIIEVQEFLQLGNHIWTSLITHLGIDYKYIKIQKPNFFDKLKSLLKESLYSLIYGMKKSAVLGRLTKGFKKLKINKKGSDVFQHPIIAALYKAREIKIANVLQEGQLTLDWYNNKVLNLEGSTDKDKKESVKSLLAQEAQLMEMVLLKPVFEIAKENREYMAITLFQHDGFTVHYNNMSMKYSLENQMKEVVRSQATSLGILTDLEGGEVR